MINLKNIDELIITHDIITKIMTKDINWISQFDKIPNSDQIQNPRIFNFSKTTKLIKLNYREHQYNIIAQKPIYQFHKNRLESSKTPICLKMPKIPMRMHEKCMKSRNKLEKEGQKGLTSF